MCLSDAVNRKEYKLSVDYKIQHVELQGSLEAFINDIRAKRWVERLVEESLAVKRPIEWRRTATTRKWEPLTGSSHFNLPANRYRVAPAPEFVPHTMGSFLEALVGKVPFVAYVDTESTLKRVGPLRAIASVFEDGITVHYSARVPNDNSVPVRSTEVVSWAKLCASYIWSDSTPCGVRQSADRIVEEDDDA